MQSLSHNGKGFFIEIIFETMYYSDSTVVFLDGQWIKAKDAKVDLFSQTMHYGLGVFEGIRAYGIPGGFNVFKALDHYERLERSAKLVHIKLPYTAEELVQTTYELLERNNLQDAYIRPLVYMGANMALQPSNEVHVFMTAWKWERYLGDELLDVMISSYRRPNPRSVPVEAKVTGHYTNSILATTEAKEAGYDEAILVDGNGFIAEGSGANLFFEKDEILFTPPEGNILPGITRATIMGYAKDLGIEVKEKLFTADEFKTADSAFFTGTASEIAGIKSVDKTKLPLKWEDSIGNNLSMMYNQNVLKQEYNNLTIV